jgi:hypothetical protein
LLARSAAAAPYIAAAALNHSSKCQGLLEGPSEGFVLHPALLEAALQTQALAPVPEQLPAAEGAMGMWVPAAIAGFFVGTAATGTQQLTITACPEQSGSSSSSSSTMQLYTDSSIPVGSIVRAELRPLQGDEAAAQLAAAGALAAAAAPAAAAVGDAARPSLSDDELALLVQSTVEGVLGQAVGSEEPLMAAGLDSLGATEVSTCIGRKVAMHLRLCKCCWQDLQCICLELREACWKSNAICSSAYHPIKCSKRCLLCSACRCATACRTA